MEEDGEHLEEIPQEERESGSASNYSNSKTNTLV